jgi:hypothetical protein
LKVAAPRIGSNPWSIELRNEPAGEQPAAESVDEEEATRQVLTYISWSNWSNSRRGIAEIIHHFATETNKLSNRITTAVANMPERKGIEVA